MRSRLRNPTIVVVLGLSLALAGPAGAAENPVLCVLTGRPAVAAPTAPQQPNLIVTNPSGQAYLHSSLASNTFCNHTYLDNASLNGQPATYVFATSNLSPYGFSAAAQGNPQGVWYDSSVHLWALYYDDLQVINIGLSWNVFIPPDTDVKLLQDSTALNSSGVETRIDNVATNNDPSAVLFVEHVYNPGAPAVEGTPSDYYTKTVGVTYNAGLGRWAIRNEDATTLPFGKTFFVFKAGPDDTVFTHTVTIGSQLSDDLTMIDNPLLNGNPDAQVLLTQNATSGVLNNHQVGVFYNTVLAKWGIRNLDGFPMAVGAVFNVLVIPPTHGAFVHQTTGANSTLNASAMSYPGLDGNPDALVYVTHNWNPPIAIEDNYNNHPIGVQYLGGHWNVINVDGAPMAPNLYFNVYFTLPRSNSFSASASAHNTTGSVLTLNNATLNTRPGAVPIATFNASPAEHAGGVYTPTVGFKYNPGVRQWTIFNLTGPSFVLTQTYNVLEAPASFVVTATAPVGDGFFVDNSLINGNPGLLLFVTARDNAGINPKNVGVYYDTGPNKWLIFNEDATTMASNVVYDVFVTGYQQFLPLVRR